MHSSIETIFPCFIHFFFVEAQRVFNSIDLRKLHAVSSQLVPETHDFSHLPFIHVVSDVALGDLVVLVPIWHGN